MAEYLALVWKFDWKHESISRARNALTKINWLSLLIVKLKRITTNRWINRIQSGSLKIRVHSSRYHLRKLVYNYTQVMASFSCNQFQINSTCCRLPQLSNVLHFSATRWTPLLKCLNPGRWMFCRLNQNKKFPCLLTAFFKILTLPSILLSRLGAGLNQEVRPRRI